MNKIEFVISIIAVTMTLYHMVFTQYLLQSPIHHMNTHLGLALVLVLLNSLKNEWGKPKERRKRLWCFGLVLFSILSLIATGYIQIQIDALQDRAYFNTILDIVIGLILILLVMETSRQAFGSFIPILSLIIIIYPFFGRLFPEPFYCMSMPFKETISNLSIGLSRGIYGKALFVSSTFVFLWIVFGSLLEAIGASRFFMQLGKFIVGNLRGGAALMAISTSALLGSITGSVAANIAITGSFTIPLMKKSGFTPVQAGAIEAAASNGGQIVPPIMGVAAFAMAGITGIPYLKIILMALIPAILYFYCCGLYALLWAEKMKITPVYQKIHVKKLLSLSYLFLGPFIVILVLLAYGFSVMYVAFWAIVTIIALSLIRKETRPSFDVLLKGIVRGAVTGAQVAAICACVGLIVSTFTMTGLAVKMSFGIATWSGGYLFPALIMISVACIIMGMGGVTLTAYILVATFAAPALVKMGVGIGQSHFFVMFVSTFAFITPPVGIGALIAARLAGGSYLKTSIEAVKVASAAFVLPLMFIYCPIILLQPQEPLQAIVGVIASLSCLTSMQFGYVGYFLKECGKVERALWLMIAATLMCFLVWESLLLTIMGIILFLLLISFHWVTFSKMETKACV